MNQRVVVTGVGAISPIGLDVTTTWSAICSGRSGITTIASFDATGLETNFAGEVKEFDAANYLHQKEIRRTDRFIHLAVAAALEALRSADLTISAGLAA